MMHFLPLQMVHLKPRNLKPNLSVSPQTSKKGKVYFFLFAGNAWHFHVFFFDRMLREGLGRVAGKDRRWPSNGQGPLIRGSKVVLFDETFKQNGR